MRTRNNLHVSLEDVNPTCGKFRGQNINISGKLNKMFAGQNKESGR